MLAAFHEAAKAAGQALLAGAPPTDITSQAPVAPPGAGGYLWGLAIILWLSFLVCMAGIAKSGGHLAWAGIHPGRGGPNGASSLMFSGVGLLITAGAGTIVTTIAAFA